MVPASSTAAPYARLFPGQIQAWKSRCTRTAGQPVVEAVGSLRAPVTVAANADETSTANLSIRSVDYAGIDTSTDVCVNVLCILSNIRYCMGVRNTHAGRRRVLRTAGGGAVVLLGLGSVGSASAQETISQSGTIRSGRLPGTDLGSDLPSRSQPSLSPGARTPPRARCQYRSRHRADWFGLLLSFPLERHRFPLTDSVVSLLRRFENTHATSRIVNYAQKCSPRWPLWPRSHPLGYHFRSLSVITTVSFSGDWRLDRRVGWLTL